MHRLGHPAVVLSVSDWRSIVNGCSRKSVADLHERLIQAAHGPIVPINLQVSLQHGITCTRQVLAEFHAKVDAEMPRIRAASRRRANWHDHPDRR